MIGIIGGTGFYSLEGLSDLRPHTIDTPFGPPSAPVMVGNLGPHKVAFMARHGEKHQFLPTEVNFRANIWALKKVGVRQIVAVSAVGSLVDDVHPGDLAVVTQYIDFTKGRRASTFFGEGIIAHVSTAHPACPALATRIIDVAGAKGVPMHSACTYACVEGPRFGTQAESFFLRSSGAELVGMTNVPEAFLAREAQLCYCCIAVATDYDCWKDDPGAHASMDKVLELYRQNLCKVQQIVKDIVEHPSLATCSCRKSLEGAVMTEEKHLTAAQVELVSFLRQ